MIPLAFQPISAAVFWGYSIVEVAIAVVIIAAIVALVYVALRQFGIAIPQWVIHVGWIIAVAFVVILAIRLVASM